jgi:hypothetical protein
LSDLATLLRELRTLEQIQAALAQLSRRQDEARKAETVVLRRQLAQQLGILGEAGRTALSSPDDQQLYSDYRQRLSAMRTAIALHQSEWPAVSLDNAPEAYHVSAQRVLKAAQDFTPWAIAQVSARQRG